MLLINMHIFCQIKGEQTEDDSYILKPPFLKGSCLPYKSAPLELENFNTNPRSLEPMDMNVQHL